VSFPPYYFTIDNHLFKVTCNRVYKENEKLMAEMQVEEVEYHV
jgi:hypothetical protein